ncbi:hypothetical protein AVEN_112853-1 [Araneus ventricosus]|uniref:Uncharacterized protein n=1 Tax=Araneus ventricosus TaxID=182803 RepID=A0A4Y2M502_ARAVE|nr:hypothetical protein AVEN_112853-1 [Araneus ventricosus]
MSLTAVMILDSFKAKKLLLILIHHFLIDTTIFFILIYFGAPRLALRFPGILSNYSVYRWWWTWKSHLWVYSGTPVGLETSLFPHVNKGKSDVSQPNRGYQNRPLSLTHLAKSMSHGLRIKEGLYLLLVKVALNRRGHKSDLSRVGCLLGKLPGKTG